MLRCLHLTDPVIKGHRSRIIDTIILIICIDLTKGHQLVIRHDRNGDFRGKFLCKGRILVEKLFQITLLILQNYQKTVCAELHGLGKLCDGFLCQISGFLNDESTSGNLCHRGGDIFLIKILCIDLCDSGSAASPSLAQSLGKTDTQRRSSASGITCDHQIAAS